MKIKTSALVLAFSITLPMASVQSNAKQPAVEKKIAAASNKSDTAAVQKTREQRLSEIREKIAQQRKKWEEMRSMRKAQAHPDSMMKKNHQLHPAVHAPGKVDPN